MTTGIERLKTICGALHPGGIVRMPHERLRGIIRDISMHLGDYSPSDFEIVGDSVQDRVADLVRRCKALAERGAER